MPAIFAGERSGAHHPVAGEDVGDPAVAAARCAEGVAHRVHPQQAKVG